MFHRVLHRHGGDRLERGVPCPLEDGDEISICRNERSLRLIHPSTRSYFEVLRQKLKWGER